MTCDWLNCRTPAEVSLRLHEITTGETIRGEKFTSHLCFDHGAEVFNMLALYKRSSLPAPVQELQPPTPIRDVIRDAEIAARDAWDKKEENHDPYV